MKKRIIAVFTALLIAVSLFPFTVKKPEAKAAEDRKNVLKVCNWEDYIDESLLEEFEAYYREKTGNENFTVDYTTFDTNETLLTKIETAKEDYDVVCPSEYAIQRLYERDLLKQIDKSKMGNFENVSPYARKQFEILTEETEEYVYAIGYCWGTLGVLYNKDHVEAVTGGEPLSWEIMWEEAFSNKILMKDSVRDSVVAAAIYAHREELSAITDPEAYNTRLFEIINPKTEEEMVPIQDALLSQKTDVGVFYEVDDGKGDMVIGTYSLNLAWSGDAWWAIDEASAGGVTLDYTVPTEGGNVWFDGWCIPKYAENEDAAIAFMDYLNSGDAAIRNMDATGYISVVATPETLEYHMGLGEEYPEYAKEMDVSYFFTEGNYEINGETVDVTAVTVNRIMLADSSTIARCAVMNDFEDNKAAMNLWNAVKGDTLSPLAMALILGAIFGIIAGAIAYRIVKDKRQKARRRAVKERQAKEMQLERAEKLKEREEKLIKAETVAREKTAIKQTETKKEDA